MKQLARTLAAGICLLASGAAAADSCQYVDQLGTVCAAWDAGDAYAYPDGKTYHMPRVTLNGQPLPMGWAKMHYYYNNVGNLYETYSLPTPVWRTTQQCSYGWFGWKFCYTVTQPWYYSFVTENALNAHYGLDKVIVGAVSGVTGMITVATIERYPKQP